ncbi:DNA-directed RNA polymerase III subunit Rpc31-domain-containing protein [Paraphoma chrysanthemicola]|nr:DNA-directed RNA polymerase III subunit Rpc31-domain-containing protein [Paraphoma chrysanthemicola]
MPPARGGGGGRGGGRGGRGGAFNPGRGTVTIAGTELNWDLTGLDIQKGPAERFPVSPSPLCLIAQHQHHLYFSSQPVFCAASYHVVPVAMSRQPPKSQSQSQPSASTLRSAPLKHPLRRQQEAPPPQAPPPTAHERGIVSHYLRARDRIHEGPFYTILNDGMKNGLKRKASEPAPTEASLFNPFTDNQTFSAKYLKVRRRLPKLDARPYGDRGDSNASKKRRVLEVTKINAISQIERMIKAEVDRTNEAEARAEDELDEDAEDDEVEADDDKPDAVDEEDNWSAVSTDSEESDDDYNAEQYFDNGEDDDIDDADPYENTYE